MAGHHQIWLLDLAQNQLGPFAGSGKENVEDGPLGEAAFAQPSGLASDGITLFVADSEVSAIRAVPLQGQGDVRTIVGRGLFEFGDVDGQGNQVRLQHPLGVAYRGGKLLVADTYNSKVKVLDPDKRNCFAFAGESGGWLSYPLFNEPGGLSVAGHRLYVADTNGHRVQIIDLNTKAIRTLCAPRRGSPQGALIRPSATKVTRYRGSDTYGTLRMKLEIQFCFLRFFSVASVPPVARGGYAPR